jgi:hypothetical protein
MDQLIARVKGMAMNPAQEWQQIAREPIDLIPVLTRYVAILAAIPAVAGFLILMWFGFFAALAGAVTGYVLTLVGVVVNAKIIELLAPKFGIPADAAAALKLAVFAPTVVWVAGGLIIIPLLGPMVALAATFYALYTLYLGVPIVVRVPQDKALTFTLAVIGVAIVVNIALRVLTGFVV